MSITDNNNSQALDDESIASVRTVLGLKVAYVNARSIPSHIIDIRYLIECKQYDVILITETWLFTDAGTDLFNISGYKIFRLDRQTRGGGVAAYFRDNFSVEALNLVDEIIVEQLWLSAKIGKTKVAFGIVYRPDHISYLCLESLNAPLEYCSLNFDHIIVAGDFNIDLLNTSNCRTMALYNLFQTYNLHQIIHESTRISSHSQTLIDAIFVSKHLLCKEVSQFPVSFSDHNFIDFIYNIPINKKVTRYIKRRLIKNINISEFNADAACADWNNVLTCGTLDGKVSLFNRIIINLLDKHAPVKTLKITKPSAPWLNDEIKLHFKRRDKLLLKLHKLQKNTLSDAMSIQQAKDSYVSAKNFCNRLIRNAKKPSSIML